jgi:hypothetical protein
VVVLIHESKEKAMIQPTSEVCGAVLHLKDWPDAQCHKPVGHQDPHDGETGTAVVTWPLSAFIETEDFGGTD